MPLVKKLKYLIALFSLTTLLCAHSQQNRDGVGTVKTIVIDAGHGGKDPGCMGAVHKEKDVALKVALKLGKYIEGHLKNVKVVYTRTTDVFVELEDRALIANKARADLFISIHCNAAGKPVIITDPRTGKKRPKMYRTKKGKLVPVETANPVPFGTETYVMGLKNEEGKMKVAQRENSAIFYEEDYEKKYGGFDPESEESYIIMSNYTSAYVIQSANLAVKIQEEYASKAGRIDKGVHRQSIWVLWRTSMPSILTEIGYLTNPLEEQFLGSEKGQDYLAKALFRGIRRYRDEMEGNKKEYNDEFENQEPLENENVKAGNALAAKKNQEEAELEEESEDTAAKAPVKSPLPTTLTVAKDTKPEKLAPPKENIKEDKFVYVKPADTAAESSNPADTALNAQAIAGRFKKETNTLSAGQAATVIRKKEELFFKVQFASSDVALDLKQEKFSNIKDADFYRMGNILKYTSGKFVSIKDAAAHQAFLREKGFKDCFVVAFRSGERIDMALARKILEEQNQRQE